MKSEKMKTKAIVLVICTVFLVAMSAVSLASTGTNKEDKQSVIFETKELNHAPGAGECVPSEFLVKFKPGLGEAAINAMNFEYGSSVKSTLISGTKVLNVPPGKTVDEMVSIYANLPEVKYAEPNFYVSALMVPNDPYYSYQWHLDNDEYGGINMESAWDISTGTGVVVAVLDTGVAYETYDTYCQAPDLAGTTFVAGYDFVNGDAHPNDDNGHGTHATGTIAQTTNNDYGVAGVAFDCSIMPVKVLDEAGSGSISGIADGIYYATNNSAGVISMSLGGPNSSQTLEDAVAYAYNNGVTLVASSGNDYQEGNPTNYPAAYDDYVIAVGATRYDETRSYYSNTGSYLDIAAPGGDTSVDQNDDGYVDGVLQQTFPEGYPCDFGYYFFQGTSMAAPHVSGVAALVIANGVTGPDNVRNALESTAEDKGTPGWDAEYGWGLVDAGAALGIGPTPTPVVTPTPTPKPDLVIKDIRVVGPTATSSTANTEVPMGDNPSDGDKSANAPVIGIIPTVVQGAGATYKTDTDNANNLGQHIPDDDMDVYLFRDDSRTPIEFYIENQIPLADITSATLTLYAWDVDDYRRGPYGTYKGEKDMIYFNGHYVGDLTGADDKWSTSTYTIDPTWIKMGNENLVNITIDELDKTAWAVQIDWGMLIINEGTVGNARIVSLNTDKATYEPGETVDAITEVDTTLSSQSVKLENNLIDPDGTILTGNSITYTTYGTNIDPKTMSLALPGTARGGNYTVEAIVYDAATMTRQDSKRVFITVPGAAAGCYVEYQIENVGNGSAPLSTTYLYVDGSSSNVTSNSTAALAAVASRWERFTGYTFTGTHSFRVCADGPNSISETSETNNCKEESLTCEVTKPDLVIKDIRVVGPTTMSSTANTEVPMGDNPSDGDKSANAPVIGIIPTVVQGAGATYKTDTDNANNLGQHIPDDDMDVYLFRDDSRTPIEFYIENQIPLADITSATLTLYAWDVDDYRRGPYGTYKGEKDMIYFNGHYVGDLTGADDKWSTSTYTIDPTWIKMGNENLVNITIDELDKTAWAVQIDWGMLIINEGTVGNARIVSLNTDKATYEPGETVDAITEVDTTLSSQSVKLENNLIDPDGTILTGNSITYTTYGTNIDPKTMSLALPGTAKGGNYTVEAIVYDAATMTRQDSKRVFITVSGAAAGCYVEYQIENVGNGSAPLSTTYLYVDGSSSNVTSNSTAALAAVASRWERFTGYTFTGTHSFRVCADGPNSISETSETNNCKEESLTCEGVVGYFDTGSGTYPSISGIHTGTITPDSEITVNNLYTYPCTGTGGHTEYVRIHGNGIDESASWTGYSGDWHNISFSEITLEAGKTYNYEIRTGSYPQIIHASSTPVNGGTITCTKFVDANGKEYTNWIPAIRLE